MNAVSSPLLRWLGTINGGQLATLWAVCAVISALALWLLATTDARNHADRLTFEAQQAEYTSNLNRYKAEVTAYRDSANELSALTRRLRGAGRYEPTVFLPIPTLHGWMENHRSCRLER